MVMIINNTAFTGQRECLGCNGTGENQDGKWTLETARQNPKAFNAYRLIQEYGPDTRVQCGFPGVVSPLHFGASGKEKCAICHGLGFTREFIKYQADAAAAERKATTERLTAEYKAKYPYLTLRTNANEPATKNIKTELKRAFPTVKFSVTRPHYSGIDIKWENGPTVDEVDAITDKYSKGSFDGMTDSYNYCSDPFTDVFGGAQYISNNRTIKNSDYTAVIKSLCKLYDVPYNAEEHRIVIEPMRESACTLVYRLLRRCAIPTGKRVAGIVSSGIECGVWEEFYKLEFADAAEAVTA